MRILITFLVPLLLLSQPARAGQRAFYLEPDGKKLAITITDDGNAVVRGEGEEQYGILRDGTFYLVGREKGVLHVARMEDMVTAFGRVLPPVFSEIFALIGKDNPKTTLRIEPAGTRKVAGFTGQVYRVYGLDRGKPSEASEVVLSKEPALQPVGKALEQFMLSSVVALAPLLGEGAAEIATDLRNIFSHGAPLDLKDKFKLVSIETAAVSPSEAALPAAPDTLDQIIASMKTSTAEAPAEQKD